MITWTFSASQRITALKDIQVCDEVPINGRDNTATLIAMARVVLPAEMMRLAVDVARKNNHDDFELPPTFLRHRPESRLTIALDGFVQARGFERFVRVGTQIVAADERIPRDTRVGWRPACLENLEKARAGLKLDEYRMDLPGGGVKDIVEMARATWPARSIKKMADSARGDRANFIGLLLWSLERRGLEAALWRCG